MARLHHLLLPLLTLCSTLAAQQLIAVDSSRALFSIDPLTGAKTQIGTVSANASTTAGLAYDPFTNTVYLTSTGNDSVYTLDIATGNATLIGPYGNSALVMHGLEFDTSTNTLYGVSSHDNGLYIIDKTTGVATLVGTSGLTSFTNLGYDMLTDTMYATNSGTDSFYTMDRATGAATLIGPLNGPTNPNGLAFDPINNRLYLIDNSTDNFYWIDVTTGQANLIGFMGTGNLLGLVYIPSNGIRRIAHGCGRATIQTNGSPTLGGSVTTQLGNVTGLGFIGLGFNVGNTPFCVCTVGHDWAAANFTSTLTLNVPNNPIYLGNTIGIQGADFLGAGGCPAPQIAFTDTMVVTIQ